MNLRQIMPPEIDTILSSQKLQAGVYEFSIVTEGSYLDVWCFISCALQLCFILYLGGNDLNLGFNKVFRNNSIHNKTMLQMGWWSGIMLAVIVLSLLPNNYENSKAFSATDLAIFRSAIIINALSLILAATAERVAHKVPEHYTAYVRKNFLLKYDCMREGKKSLAREKTNSTAHTTKSHTTCNHAFIC